MNKWKVPFVEFKQNYKSIKPDIDQAIQKCLDNGDYIMRQDLEDFEKRFAHFIGVKHAIGVGSGTDALRLSLQALRIGEGDEVITVAETFVATISMIVAVGATPVLVDVGDDMQMDVSLARKAITAKTKAIIPVHFAGGMCDMSALADIVNEYNLYMIEDACQAVGAKSFNSMAGSMGHTGCWSFYPAKILGGCGDGGMITTDEDIINKRARLLRDAGRDGTTRKKGTERILIHGYNSLLDNIQAAILNVKMVYLGGYIKRRQAIGAMYNEGLKGLPMVLPVSQVYQDYIIRTTDRDELAQHLIDAGIEVLVREVTPNHMQVGLGLRHFRLPNTERNATEKIRLPIVPELKDEQIQYVIEKIRDFYEGGE